MRFSDNMTALDRAVTAYRALRPGHIEAFLIGNPNFCPTYDPVAAYMEHHFAGQIRLESGLRTVEFYHVISTEPGYISDLLGEEPIHQWHDYLLAKLVSNASQGEKPGYMIQDGRYLADNQAMFALLRKAENVRRPLLTRVRTTLEQFALNVARFRYGRSALISERVRPAEAEAVAETVAPSEIASPTLTFTFAPDQQVSSAYVEIDPATTPGWSDNVLETPAPKKARVRKPKPVAAEG